MNSAALHNLWNYLDGLSLTASDKKWLSDKLMDRPAASNIATDAAKFDESMISPRVKRIMGSVQLDEQTMLNDPRVAYILSK